jgi:flagellar motor protein MotB
MENNIKNLLPGPLLYFATLSLVAGHCPKKGENKPNATANQKVIQNTEDAEGAKGKNIENTKNQEENENKNEDDNTLSDAEKLAKAAEKLAKAQKQIERLEQEKETSEKEYQQRLSQVEAEIAGIDMDLVYLGYVINSMQNILVKALAGTSPKEDCPIHIFVKNVKETHKNTNISNVNKEDFIKHISKFVLDDMWEENSQLKSMPELDVHQVIFHIEKVVLNDNQCNAITITIDSIKEDIDKFAHAIINVLDSEDPNSLVQRASDAMQIFEELQLEKVFLLKHLC